jgi:hypothetical protein
MVEGLPECVIATTKESRRYHKSKVSMHPSSEQHAVNKKLQTGLRAGARYADGG